MAPLTPSSSHAALSRNRVRSSHGIAVGIVLLSASALRAQASVESAPRNPGDSIAGVSQAASSQPLWEQCAVGTKWTQPGGTSKESKRFPQGGARLGPRAFPSAPSVADVDPPEVVYCLMLSARAFPATGATHAAVLSVTGNDESTFLRVAVYDPTSLVVSADNAAPQQTLLLPTRPGDRRLFVVVTREDGGRAPAGFQAMVRAESLGDEKSPDDVEGEEPGWFVRSLSQGRAFRYSVSHDEYDDLLSFAECDWLARVERQKTGCVEKQMISLRDRIYPFVSRLLGRSPERELREGTPLASRSEPMVVFFGLGGLNKILIIDCRTTAGRNEDRHCFYYTEPWVTTLQRARYVWAAYIEDDQAPFDTSIDVEFKQRAPTVDYEEFDARNLAHLRERADHPEEPRILRVGYRRFRVREAPVAIQVAFSRQGPNYGLRQWVRVYREFSARPWIIAGALFAPAVSVDLPRVGLLPIPPNDGSPPTLARVTVESDHRQVFASLVVRWPSVRGRAENEATPVARLAVNAIPDLAAGLGLPFGERKVFVAGLFWPILWDRVSFGLGWKISQEDEVAKGLVVGQAVPIGTSLSAVRVSRWRAPANPTIVGLSIELVRSR